jgi:predicted nucleotidyltransferase
MTFADFAAVLRSRASTSSARPPLEQFFGLREALERLLGRRVDLVEAGAVRNPCLLAELDRTRELIHAA